MSAVVQIEVTPLLEAAVDRYVSGCRRDGDCLVREVKGYGWIWTGTAKHLAHRAVYVVKNGPLEPEDVVRHRCDRKQCVEPTHLLRGSQAQNIRDMWERGRQPAGVGIRGEANAAAVLTDELVATMRREVRAGASIRAVARKHEAQYSSVRLAVLGLSWRHVTEPPAKRRRGAGHAHPSKTPQHQVAEAERLAAAGLSLSEIGERLGISRVTVHRVLRRAQECVA